jgi:poly(3-hydroxybutyrate) depolymerase
MRLLYVIATWLVFVVLFPVLALMTKTRDGLWQRFGFYPPNLIPGPGGPRIWLHGASAGDLLALSPMIDRLRAQYALPASRIFMAGGSNGAQMTLAYAVTHSQRLAAVASSGGSLPLNPRPGECSGSPKRALAVLLAHGSADTQMPYDGGCVADVGGGCARGRVISAQATLDFWRAVNGLAGATPVQTVEDPDASDAGPAFRFRFNGPTPVEWWRLDGAGHTVPSRTVLIEPNALTGVQSRDVEFAELAWSFFKATWVAN